MCITGHELVYMTKYRTEIVVDAVLIAVSFSLMHFEGTVSCLATDFVNPQTLEHDESKMHWTI